MGLGVGGPEELGCLKRLWEESQLSVVQRTPLRERRDLASKLSPGINCMTLSKSLPFMGLTFPIF